MAGLPRRPIWTMLTAALLICSAELVGFFLALNSISSAHSRGDIAYHVQLMHNFVNGSPFQTTFHLDRGYFLDPPPYMNQAALHINLTHYVFAPLYALLPGINGLYALILALNLGSALAFGWLCLKDVPRFAIFATALAASRFVWIAQYQAHPILFGTPFFFAAHYALLRGWRGAFWLAALALCFVSEDATLFVATYSAYLLVFEKRVRADAFALLATAAAVFAVDNHVLMPAARAGFADLHASHVSWALAQLPGLSEGLVHFWAEAWPALAFLSLLVAAAIAFEAEVSTGAAKAFGLAMLAPLSHWIITFLTYGMHHLMPVYWGMLAALVALLSSNTSPRLRQPAWRRLLAGYAFLFLLAEARHPEIRSLPRRLGDADARAAASNRAVVAAIRRLPPDRTVSYQTDPSVEGFLADRRRLWRFPHQSSEADVLIVQRGAATPGHLRALADEMIARRRTHRVGEETADYVLFERLSPGYIPEPPSSVGFGYLARRRARSSTEDPDRGRFGGVR